MYNKNIPALLCILITLASVSSCENKTPKSGDKPVVTQAQPGIYLNTIYIEALTASRSPRVAYDTAKYNDYVLAIIGEIEGGLGIKLSGWHQSYGFIEVNRDGTPRQLDPTIAIHGVSLVTATPPDRVAITIDNRVYVFVRVEDIEHFIIKKTIAGSYLGSDGKKYSFGVDGIAHFAERTFPFSVETDLAFGPDGFDRIFNLDKNLIYHNDKQLGFKWDGNQLKIYNDVLEEGLAESSEFNDPPLVVLTPVTEK